MKVLYVIDGQGGGAVTHVLELAGGLPPRGIETEVLFFSEGPALKDAGRLGIASSLIPKKEWAMPLFLWRLSRHVRESGSDIIHSHTINANFFSRVAGWHAGIPVITTVHSYIIDEMKGLLTAPPAGDRLRYRLDLAMAGASRVLVAVSKGIRDRLLERGIAPDRVSVIPNGIDLGKFRPAGEHPEYLSEAFSVKAGCRTVAIVARLVPLKDHETFLKAARGVASALSDVRFLIIGDGPLRERLEHMAEDLGIADRVVFAGWRSDIQDVLPIVDVAVMCSRTEGHGVAVLEAMACGKPVIGSNVPEINNTIVHGETGLLVPAGDAAAFTAAMLDLLSNAERASEMGRQARRYVEEHCSVEGMLQRYEALYRSVAP